jgi:hypothetical protein
MLREAHCRVNTMATCKIQFDSALRLSAHVSRSEPRNVTVRTTAPRARGVSAVTGVAPRVGS